MKWTNKPKHMILKWNKHSDKLRHSKDRLRRYNDILNSKKDNPQSQHDDLTEKLKKYADLKQQGILTEEEFQKLKMDMLSKI
jgi:hypothetical protein